MKNAYKKVCIMGLLIAVALISACYGTQETTGSTTSTENSIEIKGFAFNPSTTTVKKGTTVTWTNKDNSAHTVTTTNAPESFDSGSLSKDKAFSQTFNTAGTYEYYCSIHPNMKGKLIVTE